MPRRLRVAAGGIVYHVLNRAVGRGVIFDDDNDYLAFEKVLAQAFERTGTRLLAYCLMPNHWHLVLWPRKDGELSQHVRWLSVTHTQRWHAHHHTAGTGPLYQGRFKSFPIQQDRHLLLCCRYVERNPVRAGMVRKAANWRWSSAAERSDERPWLLSREKWPAPVPPDWHTWVDEPQNNLELEAMRRCIKRGAPFGDDRWTGRTVKKLSLESSLRPPHRPKKREANAKKDS